jgi:hypothetical protein
MPGDGQFCDRHKPAPRLKSRISTLEMKTQCIISKSGMVSLFADPTGRRFLPVSHSDE